MNHYIDEYKDLLILPKMMHPGDELQATFFTSDGPCKADFRSNTLKLLFQLIYHPDVETIVVSYEDGDGWYDVGRIPAPPRATLRIFYTIDRNFVIALGQDSVQLDLGNNYVERVQGFGDWSFEFTEGSSPVASGLSESAEQPSGATKSGIETAEDLPDANQLQELVALVGFDMVELSNETLPFLINMFEPDAYRAHIDVPPNMTERELFLNYLTFGLEKGLSPGPLFDPQYYLDQLTSKGHALPEENDPPFHHWLREGVSQRIETTPLYDPQEYLALNPDLKLYPGWLFEHWVNHGIDENRRFDRNLQISRQSSDPSSFVEGRQKFLKEFLSNNILKAGWIEAVTELRRFRQSSKFAEFLNEARGLEPEIGTLDDGVTSLIPPLHDGEYACYRAAVADLAPNVFDTVVMMPHCKMGGADLVAALLVHALCDLNRKVLILRTEASDWERPDWFPEDVRSIDISRYLGALPNRVRTRAIYEIFRHLRPNAVFNVNSYWTFETFDEFGKRLSCFTRQYCYYFCADMTPQGLEAGYPVTHFAPLLPNLEAAMCDTRYLANQLSERFALPDTMKEKVRVIYSSFQDHPKTVEAPNTGQLKLLRSERPLILWAGRLDRQKRFDLVLEIAALMPDVDFACWGKAVLDQPPSLDSLPSNLVLYEPFMGYEELPLERCNGWLYTSAWDGLPTILIELGARRTPIVASAVGGVPELIDETTGWPIAGTASTGDYVAAINNMISNPAEARKRAMALRDRVLKRHSRDQFKDNIRALLEANDHG